MRFSGSEHLWFFSEDTKLEMSARLTDGKILRSTNLSAIFANIYRSEVPSGNSLTPDILTFSRNQLIDQQLSEQI